MPEGIRPKSNDVLQQAVTNAEVDKLELVPVSVASAGVQLNPAAGQPVTRPITLSQIHQPPAHTFENSRQYSLLLPTNNNPVEPPAHQDPRLIHDAFMQPPHNPHHHHQQQQQLYALQEGMRIDSPTYTQLEPTSSSAGPPSSSYPGIYTNPATASNISLKGDYMDQSIYTVKPALPTR